MEVILLQDTNLGDKGSVVKVAGGYARNFLIPNGMAVLKTAGNLRHVAEIDNQRKKKLDKQKSEVQALAQKINSAAPVVIKTKGGDGGVMFGSITHAQIAEALEKELGLNIDRRRIMARSIKEAGQFDIPIKLTLGVTANAKLKVEVEYDKKKDEGSADEKKKKKLRKKEEIVAEIEAKEAAQAEASLEAAPAPVEATVDAKPKKAKKKKE